MRPRTWLARCGQCTDGRIRKRLRQTTRSRCDRRPSSSHPIQRSRAATRSAAAEKPGRAEPAVRRADEVADLAAREGRHPVRMLARDQRVPQGPVRSARDGDDPEVPYPRGMRRHILGFGDIRLELARPVPDRRRLRRRKGDAGIPLGQGAERFHASGKPRPAARVEKRELLADAAAQGGSAVEPFLRQDRRHPRDRRLVPQGAADL